MPAVFVSGTQIRVPVPIAHLIAMEASIAIGSPIRLSPISATGIVSTETIIPVEVIVDMSPEAPWTVVPGSRADEDSAYKPIRPVVAIGGTFVWRVIEITVGAHRRRSDLHRNLRVCLGWRNRNT